VSDLCEIKKNWFRVNVTLVHFFVTNCARFRALGA
jgi:hypothetical protein